MKFIYVSLFVLLVSLQSGCGSEGTISSGKTVTIDAALKTGASGAIFATYSTGLTTATLTQNSTGFTLKSNVYPNVPSNLASDVQIQSVSVSFVGVPQLGFPVVPPMEPYNFAWTGKVPAGGTMDIENVSLIRDVFAASDSCAGATFLGQYLYYDIRLAFNGVELKTNTPIVVPAGIQARLKCR